MLYQMAAEDASASVINRFAARGSQAAFAHRDRPMKAFIRKLTAPLSMIFAIAAAYSLVTQRSAVVQAIPGTAVFFKVVGLPVNIFQAEFMDVRANILTIGGGSRLVVEGQIRNLKPGKNPVPDVQISTAGGDGAASYSWVVTLPEKTLGRGGSLKFKASLDNPPTRQESVILNFAQASGANN